MIGLGAAMAIGLNLGLSPDAFASWGWRVPFILGILIGPTGWYLRQRCDESPEFKAYLAEKAATAQPSRQTTLGQLFSEHPRELIASFCLIAAGTAINYVNANFLPTYAVAELKLPILNAQLGLLVVSLINAAVAVACGALSDRIGRRAVLVPALIVYSLLFYVILQRLVAAPTTANLWQLQIVAVLLGALAGGPAPGGVGPALRSHAVPGPGRTRAARQRHSGRTPVAFLRRTPRPSLHRTRRAGRLRAERAGAERARDPYPS